MTEADAKTKICFHALTFGASQQLANGPGPHCIGSDCMAWRWRTTPERAVELTEHRHTTHPDDPPTVESGFCGLAGEPLP